MNGADFITQSLLHLLGRKGFTIVQQPGGWISWRSLVLRHREQFHIRLFIPVLAGKAPFLP